MKLIASAGSQRRPRAHGSTLLAAFARLVLVLVALLVAAPLSAQINPAHRWFTIRTEHFYVHFTRPTEPFARRLAGQAERAYAELSKELHPPRGPIDIVVTDDADLSNGSATPYPTPRVVIYANPPVSEGALRYTNDWGQMVVTHELTHIFHLDRTRGVWALGQKIFGRAALSFPNLYQPAWLTEGLAVYEESRIAGAGRVQGSEHRMIARATAFDDLFPSIGALSLAQGRYPFGNSAYAFGSLFIDFLAKTRGEARVRTLVEKSSANLIPYLIDVPARQAFGVSFSRAWGEFGDSIRRTLRVADARALEGWRELTRDGVFANAPRWWSDSALTYTGATGRETLGAFRVDLTGRRTRIGRRNSRSANVRLADGSILFSQLDYTNPYELRSDLWIQRGGSERQLTHGQRVFAPDVRADGEIVAVQIVPGSTRLVRVSRDGERITPLTTGTFDETWTEPRWSHSGKLIVASRWLRGNISQVVVIDTAGTVVRTISSGPSIEGNPSWLPGDRGILYNSDRTGSAQLYLHSFDADRPDEHGTTVRLSNAITGLFEPNAAPSAPRAAAVTLRADGFHLGVGACCEGGVRVPEYHDTVPRTRLDSTITATGPARRYSPWRSLLPRYWLPTVDQGIRNGYLIGAMTSGVDVIGRHAFTASASYPTNDLGGVEGSFSYTYSGLGLPVLQFDASQEWDSFGGIVDRRGTPTLLGELFRRTWDADLLASWTKAGYRAVWSLNVGPGVEYRTFKSVPGGLIPRIDSVGQFDARAYPYFLAAASYANYQRPPQAISVEDGVQASVTFRDRFRSGVLGNGGQSLSLVGAGALYKSLNLPGFAHHVIAVRGAGGWADNRTNSYFSVGGVSGNPFQVVPGYVLGEGRKTFPVRGFETSQLVGTRALAGSAEYRLPLVMFATAPGILPFFFDRSSLTIFGDYGTAWCPTVNASFEVCNTAGRDQRTAIASVGAELNLNVGVLSWDVPYRFRLGVAHPTHNGTAFGRQDVQVYLVSGISF